MSLPSPIDIFGRSAAFELESHYSGLDLDTSLTFKSHFGCELQKIHKAKKDLAQHLYSNDMGMGNKVLLYKMVLSPILMYGLGSRGIHDHAEASDCSEPES